MQFISKLILVLGLSITMLPLQAGAAPKSNLIDDRWKASGSADFDHSAWASFLSVYVKADTSGVNKVAYGKVSAVDKTNLKAYLNDLQAIDPTSLGKNAQMAYWINLYNAATVDVILDNYPVKSIRKIGGGVFSSGPWDEDILVVAGQELSLNDVEHGILRPIWNDPRIHYAVNCASIGCPNLALKPFTAANLESMLDKAAADYVNHPRGASVKDGKLTVSSIYEWYKVDFGGNDTGVIKHLKKHANTNTASALAGVSKISGDDYNWNLNE